MADFEMEQERIMEIREAVENFFDKDSIKHRSFDERNVASAIFGVDTKFKHATIFFHAYKNKLLIRTSIPLSADEDDRAKVGEFILRANYGLKIGGFDFDFRDGEISYRISMYCGDKEFMPPTYEQISYAVMVGLAMVERYGNALAKVLFGVIEPEDAIEAVESGDD